MREKEHKMFERLFLKGESKIGDWMDLPSIYLKSHHRVLFHTVPEVLVLAKLVSQTDGSDYWFNVKAGLLHLLIDSLHSQSYKNLTEDEYKKIKEGRNGEKASSQNVSKQGSGRRRIG